MSSIYGSENQITSINLTPESHTCFDAPNNKNNSIGNHENDSVIKKNQFDWSSGHDSSSIRFDVLPICLREKYFFSLLFILESPMIPRGTLDISRRRTVCVRDVWADRTGRKASASAALRCSCRPSYCAGPARASGDVVPTRRATCPSPWVVPVCHCWRKTGKHIRPSQAWKEYRLQIPLPLKRMDWTDPFEIFFLCQFSYFLDLFF